MSPQRTAPASIRSCAWGTLGWFGQDPYSTSTVCSLAVPNVRLESSRLGCSPGRAMLTSGSWRAIEAPSPAWRAGVQLVAIDMCTVFKATVRTSLPHARLVVDRFHVAQLANAALRRAHHQAPCRRWVHRLGKLLPKLCIRPRSRRL